MKKQIIIFFWVASLFSRLQAQSPAVFKVDVAHPGADISPSMWGLFFEDINMGDDGDVYRELVKNRCLEFIKPSMSWKETKKEEGTGKI